MQQADKLCIRKITHNAMLTFSAPIKKNEIVMEAIDDLTEAFVVYYNHAYIGRVVRSICLPHWLTSDFDNRRFGTAEAAADALVSNWKIRHQSIEPNKF
jgi:hypothetical protein